MKQRLSIVPKSIVLKSELKVVGILALELWSVIAGCKTLLLLTGVLLLLRLQCSGLAFGVAALADKQLVAENCCLLEGEVLTVELSEVLEALELETDCRVLRFC